MKDWWKLQAGRIDALSLRERMFLFLSCLAVLVALADSLWLAPAQTRQKQVAATVRQQEADLNALREVLRSSMLNPANDSNQAAREELAGLQEQLAQVRAQMAQVPMSDSTESLHKVLLQFLKRYDGLTLVRAATLNPEATAPAPARPASGAPAALPTLVRTGMELTVSGAYPDLMRYVETLERALPGLRWGAMSLKTDAGKPQLTLQVSLVGVKS